MPSRASTSFLRRLCYKIIWHSLRKCQCPHGLVPHFYVEMRVLEIPSTLACQCPHGLVPHFYPERMTMSFVNFSNQCQCPHGLVPHFYPERMTMSFVNFSNQCQCPHGLVPHFYAILPHNWCYQSTMSVNALTG